jgi:hypothetical protein
MKHISVLLAVIFSVNIFIGCERDNSIVNNLLEIRRDYRFFN